MQNKKIRRLLAVVLATVALISTGCSSDNGADSANGATNQEDQGSANLSGDINAGGSTSVESAALATMEEFKALNPEVTFVYDATGSSTGIKNAKDGTYKLGFSSRDLKEEEKDGITFEAIALDGIALAVNPANGVEDLTLEQVKDIYLGAITNWSELGGVDADIVVVSRESGSGTRGAFEEIVGFEDSLTDKAIIKNGNGEVATYLTSEPNAIGYISFTTLEENADSVKGLTVNGAKADVASVQDGSYPISRPFMMVYDEASLNAAEKAYVDFLFSEEGQDIIEDTGAIRVK